MKRKDFFLRNPIKRKDGWEATGEGTYLWAFGPAHLIQENRGGRAQFREC